MAGCAKPAETTAPTAGDSGPTVDSNTYVSTDEEEQLEEEEAPDDGFAKAFDCECEVTTPEAAHELADTAVADRLNPKQTWTASPVFPASWPATERIVRVFFYPMAQDPGNMSQGVLLSAKYSVDISLEDGTTQVNEIKKSRKLGVVEDRRPSMLERNELGLAERALVHTVLGGDATTGENSFWGYKKFFLEHPKMAKDLKVKSPKFYRWVQGYKK